MIRTPSNLDTPALLMNFPFTLDTGYVNNAVMEIVDDRTINQSAAFSQFMTLYQYVTRNALVYLLPSEGNYQDQVYVANLGCYLPHIKDRNVMLLAHFKSPPRIHEDRVGMKFFTSMAYEVHQLPFFWEGEADLKWIRDNIYIAGHGIRTEPLAHKWMSKKFDMELIPLEMHEGKMYHLDLMCFPLASDKIVLCTSLVAKETIKAIEKYAQVIDIPEKYIYTPLACSVKLGNTVLFAGPRDDSDKPACDWYVKMIESHGMQAKAFDLGEYAKSGASLACMFMHLNYK